MNSFARTLAETSLSLSDAPPESAVRTQRTLRIGVLHNPLSGRNRKRGLGRVYAALAHRPQVPSYEVRTPGEVTIALAELERQTVNVVVINGGDGTVQAVLTALFRDRLFPKPPLLAVLAGGTTNMTAGDVGITGSPARGLQRLLDRLATGIEENVRARRPLLEVNFATAGSAQYGFFFSAGALQWLTHRRWAERNTTRIRALRGGLGTALFVGKMVTKLLLKRPLLGPSPVQARLDGHVCRVDERSLLFVTTLERMALGLRPFWGTEPAPLHFTAITLPPRYLLQATPALLRGRTNRYLRPEFGYLSHNASEIRLGCDDGFLLDGQPFEPAVSEPVVIRRGPCVDFIRC